MVSYDYEFLKTSIPLVYHSADEIYLAIDINNNTWSGNKFQIHDSFFDWINKIDKNQKIKIYKDDFYDITLSSKENDTRERNMLAKRMGLDGWHIQIDADEYHFDFKSTVKFIKRYNRSEKGLKFSIKGVPIIKKLSNGMILSKSLENFVFATNKPEYINMRDSFANININIRNSFFIHDTWGRNYEEMKIKLNNWSHKDEFNVKSFLNLWNAIDKYNYKSIGNFHPFNHSWKGLEYVDCEHIDDLLANVKINKLKYFFYDSFIDKYTIPQFIIQKIKKKLL